MRLPTLLAVLVGLVPACAVPSVDAIRDLSAIHDPVDWSPRTPAAMTVPPGAYLGDPFDSTWGPGRYEVTDHRQLELAILDRVAASPRDEEALSLEACSWLLTELLADDHGAARVRAASILSDFAGHWVTRLDVRLPQQEPAGDLEAAVRLLDAVEEREDFVAAVAALQSARLDDPLTGVRLLAGLGRTAQAYTFIDQRDRGVFQIALRVVLLGLESCAEDPDAAVAQACAERAQLVRDYASRDEPL